MLGFVSSIWSGISAFFTGVWQLITNIAGALLWLVDQAFLVLKGGLFLTLNGLFLAMSELLKLLFAVLPNMPGQNQYVTGEWVGWLNWFMPMGTLLVGASLLIGFYVTFLTIKYALSVVRAI